MIIVAEFNGVEGKEIVWIEVDEENGEVSEHEDTDVDVDEMVGKGGLFMKVLDNGGGSCCCDVGVDDCVVRVSVRPRKSIGLRSRVCVSTYCLYAAFNFIHPPRVPSPTCLTGLAAAAKIKSNRLIPSTNSTMR